MEMLLPHGASGAVMVPLAITLTIIHVQKLWPDIADVFQWLFKRLGELQDEKEDSPTQLRVEEEMWLLRQRGYLFACRLLVHLAFLAVLMCISDALTKPVMVNFLRVGFVMSTYMQHFAVANGLVELTILRMKILIWFLHFLLVFFMLASKDMEGSDFAAMQGFQVAIRFSFIFMFVRKEVTIPFQFVYTGLDLWIFLSSETALTIGPFLFAQAFVMGMIISTSILLDWWIRSRVQAVFDTADAQGLLSSFRRMLRGVCDGEVLLDNKLGIHGESECVKHLIFTTVSLTGRNFAQLLVEDEQQVFRDFIETSTQQAMASQEQDEASKGAPQCLRVSFRGSSGARVAVDLYHVPVAGLFGLSVPHHLIALKEDADHQLPEAQEDAVPLELLSHRGKDHEIIPNLTLGTVSGPRRTVPSTHSASALSGRSSASSQSSADAVPPDLAEMTLLVDVATDLHDVQEAHMRFERQSQEPGDPMALQSGMPSMRKFVKPTDWEKIRSKLCTYAEDSQRNPRLAPKAIKKLFMRMPEQPSKFVSVQETWIKAFPSEEESPKVWLHMKGFKAQKRHAMQPSLDGIQEARRKPRSLIGDVRPSEIADAPIE